MDLYTNKLKDVTAYSLNTVLYLVFKLNKWYVYYAS